jgi:hypothetical protein
MPITDAAGRIIAVSSMETGIWQAELMAAASAD